MVDGAKQWFHVVSSVLLIYLAVHAKRGNKATDDMGVLPRFGGVLVHDRWAPYWTYRPIRHAICSAHILRDLAAIAEVDRYKPWADAMASLLVEAKRRCDSARDQGRARAPRPAAARARRPPSARRRVLRQPPATAGRLAQRQLHRDAHNLAAALRDHRHEVLRFAADLAVPFDNYPEANGT